MTHRLILTALLIATLNACFIFDSDSDVITGDYEVLWIDSPKSRALVERYSSTGSTVLVREYVFAVGHNEDFIVVKQHPVVGDPANQQIQIDVTNYFIVDINNALEQGSKVLGPFSEDQFKRKMSHLKVGDIEFDQVYTEDPI